MRVERSTTRTSTVDVLDRVLDKGIVIDAQVRVSVIGLHLVDIDARVIIASIETYLTYAKDIAVVEARTVVRAADPPAIEPPAPVRSATAARVRRRHRRRRALLTLRCALGCTFRRASSTAERAKSVRCPYQPDVMCTLQAA